jgi:hypothetical protein
MLIVAQTVLVEPRLNEIRPEKAERRWLREHFLGRISFKMGQIGPFPDTEWPIT